MKYCKIASDGLFIEDVITDKPSADLIATPCPSGFYWPKWDGAKWVEGRTAAEIAAIQAQVTNQPPTTEEVLTDLITVLVDTGVITSV